MFKTFAFLATTQLAIAHASSLPEPDPDVSLLLQAQASGRSNAFDDLWLLRFDIPEADRPGITDADVERINARLESATGNVGGALAPSDLDSSAAGRYPTSMALPADAPPLCDLDGDDCLARVRAAADDYAHLLQREAALLSRQRALIRHDHFRNRFVAHPQTPVPSLSRLSLPLTQAALDFVEGRTGPALAALCNQALAWRRIGANSDSLVVTMVATSLVQGNASVYAQMLLELPPGHAGPAECATAFAPPSAKELSLCTAMSGEYALHQRVIQDLHATRAESVAGTDETASFNPQHTLALMAGRLAWSCTNEALDRLHNDLPAQPPALDIDLSQKDCLTNAVGCILADTASPAYDGYVLRRQDMAARLRLVDTLRRLRNDCGDEPVASCLERIDTGSPARPITLDRDGGALRVDRYGNGSHWRVALPADLSANR